MVDDVPRTSLAAALGLRAARTPGRTAYVFLAEGEEEQERLTYTGLDARARAIAAALSRSAAPGDRALLLDPPGLDFVAAFFGCLYAGVIAVPAYPPRSPRMMPRLLAILADAQPAVALAAGASLQRVRGWLERIPEAAALSWLATDELDPAPTGWQPPAPDGEAVAFLQYTSGSTATPKGVMVTQANLVHNQRVIEEACGHSEESVFVSWLPLYHDLGLIGNLLQAAWVGAPCVLMAPVAFLQNPSRWLRAVSRYRGTTSGAPNFAYDLCVRRVPPAEIAKLDLSSWQVAFNGAEPVREETLARFAAACAPAGFRPGALYPCYGLAEATLMVSGGRPGEEPVVRDVGGRRLVGCGRGLRDLEVAIVDPGTGVPCPPGEVGEIWVAGDSVARGYWNRPEETAEAFGARLAAMLEDNRGPWLRTGDLGALEGGELLVAGRLKDLIILRGRNHYPQDLEATAGKAHPALAGGTGAAFAVDVDGEERLVIVHEVERHAGRLDEVAAAVRQAIAEEHEALVWEVVLVLPGGVPRTTSGKVQRRACRDLYLRGELRVLGASRLSPAAADEDPMVEALPGSLDWLCRSFAAAARVDPARVDPDRPLSASGLDSLAAVELKHTVEKATGVSLSLAELLEGMTLREVAAVVESNGSGWSVRSARSGEALGESPLSWNQRSLWVLHRLAPESAAYHIAGAARLPEGADPERLRRALQALVDRHAILRTTYEERPEGPVQRIAERLEVAFQHEDASLWSEAELQRRIREEAFRPFDLERGPVFRASLLTRGAAGWLVLSVHHIAADLWSLGILVRELGIAYAEGPERLPETEATYLGFVRWQEEMLAGPRGERLAEHWRRRLDGAPPLDLPGDHPRPPVQGFRGVTRTLRLEPGLTAAVVSLARERGCTVFVVLLAAFETLLARISGQVDFVVGSPTSGRGSARWADVVGYFADLVALRVSLAGAPTGDDLLRRARREALDAFEHQDFPLALLAESGRLQAALSWERSPAPELAGLAAFALGEAGARLSLHGLELESAALPSPGAQRDLSLLAAELDGRLVLSLQADADLFDAVTAERLLVCFAALLRGLAATPERRVAELEMLGETERQTLLVDWNATAAEIPRACIHELVEARSEETPEAPALHGEDGCITTYRVLVRRAWGLAQWLRDRGLRDEEVVGVCLERSPEMVAAALGVLAAGGAYLPLHPAHPPERLASMLDDAGARFVLTREGLAGRLRGAAAEPVFAGALAAEPATRPPRRAGPESLSYVIYTSGSTGTPKGSALCHAGLVNLATWHREAFSVVPADRTAQVAAPGFDAAVWEIWSCLAAGASLLFPPDAVLASPSDLWSWVAAHRVTLCFLPTPLMDLALGEGVPPDLPLRWLFVGGDRLQRRPPAGRRLGNLYGPTEATVITVASVVSPEGTRPPSIGRPIANTRTYILDAQDAALSPVPPGVTGELFVAGAGLGRGYLGRPDLTAAAFLPDPFGGPGGRLYRTGDLARWLPDGRIECLGRADHQVKIRGFRVEPGEVEAVLASLPGVREAAVVVHGESPGDRRLAAWVVAAEEDAAGLRAGLAERLPAHMVPAAVGFLPALPRNASGKVDRLDLARRTPPADGAVESYEAPRTPAEELIAAIWADLLGAERIGLRDDFFDRGGHSLLASRAMARLRKPFGVELPLRTLFENPTAGAFAAAVERARRERIGDAPPPLRPMPRPAGTPLSFAQERLWFLDRLAPGQAVYNVPVAVRLRGSLDPGALQRALDGVLERHEALRTVFAEGTSGPVQIVLPPAPCALERVDLAEAAALRSAADEVRRPFDLAAGPILRALLFHLAPDDHLLVLTIHHIAVDGWSLGLLLRDLEALYQPSGPGDRMDRPELPPLPLQYADYAIWQRGWMTGEVLERRIAWWRATLAGAPEALELPADRPRPAAPSRCGTAVPFVLPAPLVRRLRETARRGDATLFMALLAGFSALLSRLSHQLDLVVGTAAANRDRAELEELVGFFVNALPVRLRLDGSPGLQGLLGRAREAALGAFTHGDVPFERLVEALAPRRNLAHTPLFQVSLALQETPARPPRLAGMDAAFVPLHTGTARFDLNLVLEEDGGALSGGVEANADLFEATTVERLLRRLATLLDAAAADPERPLEDLPLLAPEERRQILEAWSSAGWELPAPALLHELFAEQAARTPDKIAAVCRSEALTYRELDERAGRLARLLRSLDGDLAGLLAGPDHPLLVGMLGSLKAGGGFVPLDPRSPAERLERMMADCGLTVLLTDRRHLPLAEEVAQRCPGVAHRICLDDDLEPGIEQSGSAGDGTAYVIFTSGSTGIPNGVPITHENLVPLLQWSREAFGFGERTRALQSLSYAFDFGVFEILTTLLFGGTLVLQGDAVRGDIAGYLDEIRRHGIDTLHTTPSLFAAVAALAHETGERLSTLEVLHLGGEALGEELVEEAFAVTGERCRLFNGYGPTEAAVNCSLFEVDRAAGGRSGGPAAVPIGRPSAANRLYVLDPGTRPVPAGTAGELAVGGPGLSRGYLRRPDLTADRFRPDPFGTSPGERLYRTGDLVRWRTDGALDYLGRRDQQVKIRGFRVEPGEVEAALARHPRVRQAAVVAAGEAGGRRLVAYVVPDGEEEIAGAELRAFLRTSLPDHMVPASFVALPALPLSTNGKVDRRALPDPGEERREFVAPRNAVEEMLAAVWTGLLGVEQVGAHDDFFALGGHSLLVARLVTEVSDTFGVRLPVAAVFDAPTLAELAARIAEEMLGRAGDEILAEVFAT